MAEIKWIRISTDIFDNRKIKQIEKLPEGDGIIIIWVKLLTLAGQINDNGMIYFTKEIPYTEEMLSTEFNRPLNLIKLALNTFLKFKMIEIIDNIYHISNWEKYQNADGLEKIREQTRKRVQKYREKIKLNNSNVTETLHVTQCNAIEEDIDKNKNKINNSSSSSSNYYIENEEENDNDNDYINTDLYDSIKNYFEKNNYKSSYELFYKYNIAKNNNLTKDNFKKFADLWEAREKEKKSNNQNNLKNYDFLDDYIKDITKTI